VERHQNVKVKQERILEPEVVDAEKEEEPNEKEPRNLEKVQNQQHTEVRILKLEKPVKTTIANGGSV
jgi:hypothetical protein